MSYIIYKELSDLVINSAFKVHSQLGVDTRFILSSTGVFAELFSQVTKPFYK